jgi:hypothetical protein
MPLFPKERCCFIGLHASASYSMARSSPICTRKWHARAVPLWSEEWRRVALPLIAGDARQAVND